ncbi:hypothetical protein [Cellulomonas phragmiteti]|uniref:DUF4333 domain-containing protein n=1 Tax=Cellulomonas phragmiteti TaxID=478780 RepID=A0ABQ4DQF3_9CELL|nr:hypothetical protein [Cellulomonas phragmiteti]GIG41592.1 hypothetical protein Cph01nite_33540 [Cellulomonas phragmiteti]
MSAGRATGVRRRPLTWVLAAVSLVVLVVLLVALGVIRPLGSDVARPPCDQLPSAAEVAAALEAHTDLTTRIEGVGGGVRVTSGVPCADDPDRAVVEVRYRAGTERTAVEEVLNDSDGYGVPVELVQD